MRVALIGYGKMGREIEQILLAEENSVVLKIEENNIADFTTENLQKADVAFEFTHPEAAVENILKCFKAGVPVVCGTTGWYQHLPMIEDAAKEWNGSLFYAPNFSIGVNLFWEAATKLSAIMNRHPEYRASIEEIHHIRKKDAPSGTAIKLAEEILPHLTQFNGWQLYSDTASDKLVINAKREGEVPGTHILQFNSSVDSIVLEHRAYSRKGFASGAVVAAGWLIGKKGVFTMKNLLNQF